MTESYEEVIQGESLYRPAPGERHERVCRRLHRLVADSIPADSSLRLRAPRSLLELDPGTWLHPDLLLTDKARSAFYLIAEIIDRRDHSIDTVLKKRLYEELNPPRLWMIDPRYDNLEIYHGTDYGLMLKRIIAGREILDEARLPELNLPVCDLFCVAED